MQLKQNIINWSNKELSWKIEAAKDQIVEIIQLIGS